MRTEKQQRKETPQRYFQKMELICEVDEDECLFPQQKQEPINISSQDLANMGSNSGQYCQDSLKNSQKQVINVLLVGSRSSGRKTLKVSLQNCLMKREKQMKNAQYDWATYSSSSSYSTNETFEISLENHQKNKIVKIHDLQQNIFPKVKINESLQKIKCIDAILLVVNSSQSINQIKYLSERGQLFNFLQNYTILFKEQGIQRIIVAVTCMQQVEWDEVKFLEVQAFIKSSYVQKFGFRQQDIAFVPLDSMESFNIIKQRKKENIFYQGPCLEQILQQTEPLFKNPDGPLRMSVTQMLQGNFGPRSGLIKWDLEEFLIRAKVISGKVYQLSSDGKDRQLVLINPLGYTKSIQVKKIRLRSENLKILYALPETQVDLSCILTSFYRQNPTQIQEDKYFNTQISRNSCLITSAKEINQIHITKCFKAEISLFKSCKQYNHIFCGGRAFFIVFQHCAQPGAVIEKIQAKYDKKTRKYLKKEFILPGENGMCQIQLRSPICLEKGSIRPVMARFFMIINDSVVGYGRVVKLKVFGQKNQQK